MAFNTLFYIKQALIGTSLSMDAFSICLVNGLAEEKMRFSRACIIAGMFALAQFVMPLLGWLCVYTVAEQFLIFERLIPFISLILLGYIGANMIYDSFHHIDDASFSQDRKLGFILLQSIATSIDSLSVGFTTSAYTFSAALISSLIIGITTFAICIAGALLGKRFGKYLAGKAGFVGGAVLIIIGIEIFISSF
ncbi:MAG: manganese efflux pump [Oscillospiraceae bacterium]|nr:manganese efflux pump [Oscillospiraceae bacterium]